MFGILHCQGKPADKAEQLYNVLQEGGKAEHAFISAGDKDMAPVFRKLCDFVSKDAFGEFPKIAAIPTAYSSDDIAKFDDDMIERFREDVYLEDVFGANSRMQYEEWLQASTSKGAWLLSASSLRKKVLEAAGLPNKY